MPTQTFNAASATPTKWERDWARRPKLRGWLHVAALPAMAAAGSTLIARRPGKRGPLAAYTAGVCAMLGTSAAYHRLTKTETTFRWAQRADHAAIFAAIAGTATPLIAAVTTGRTRVAAVGATWVAAAAAAGERVVGLGHGRTRGYSYLVLGWAGAAIAPALLHRHGVRPTALLAAGGVAYTAGAVMFASQWPNSTAKVFGYHEVWHAMTLAGIGLHLAAVADATRGSGLLGGPSAG